MTPCAYRHQARHKPPAKWVVTTPWSDVAPIFVCGIHARQFRTWNAMGGRYRLEPVLREVTR
jgi:hypothetical protein